MNDPRPSRPPMAPPRDFLDRRALLLSLGLHLGLLVVIFGVLPRLHSEPVIYQTVQLEIVSAPPATAPDPRPEEMPVAPEEELVVETPVEAVAEDEEPTPVPEEVAADPEDSPAPEEEIAETPPPEPPDSTPPDPAPPAAPAEEENEEGGEDIVVRTQGVRRDHPAYWENIVRQMTRCFRLPPSLRAAGLSGAIDFVIHTDGSVTDVDVGVASGSFLFDNEAITAAENCLDGRLGQLPDGYPYDVMPIRFFLRPSGAGSSAAEAPADRLLPLQAPDAPGEAEPEGGAP